MVFATLGSVFKPRIVEPAIERSLAFSPVVVLEGGRAVGKSTVCDMLGARHGWAPRVDLSEPSTRATLRLDPERFLSELPTPCVIDEAQLEPDLLLWVKRIVDRRRKNGQFLLTGSARLGRNQLGGSDPLAGRAVRLTMWSMTEREKRAVPRSTFVERAFGGGFRSHGGSLIDARIGEWLGGRSVAQWEREIAAYVEAVLPLSAAGTRADLGRLLRTFRYLAANSGQLVSYARASSELAIQAATVRNHLELLEAGFLLFRAEAHRSAEHRTVSAHPRVFATDLGLAYWAARAFSGNLPAAVRGMLVETRLAHDIAALAAAESDRILVRHWRDDRNKHEVDLLLVHADGRTVPIEVKASTTVGPDDTRGLIAFVASSPATCSRALLVYEGDRVVNLTPKGFSAEITAIPRGCI